MRTGFIPVSYLFQKLVSYLGFMLVPYWPHSGIRSNKSSYGGCIGGFIPVSYPGAYGIVPLASYTDFVPRDHAGFIPWFHTLVSYIGFIPVSYPVAYTPVSDPIKNIAPYIYIYTYIYMRVSTKTGN